MRRALKGLWRCAKWMVGLFIVAVILMTVWDQVAGLSGAAWVGLGLMALIFGALGLKAYGES